MEIRTSKLWVKHADGKEGNDIEKIEVSLRKILK
jgi:hypothetical protein